MAACFWKALSVYPVTIGEKNEKKKRGEKQTINHATKQNGERVIIGMQFKNIVDQKYVAAKLMSYKVQQWLVEWVKV